MACVVHNFIGRVVRGVVWLVWLIVWFSCSVVHGVVWPVWFMVWFSCSVVQGVVCPVWFTVWFGGVVSNTHVSRARIFKLLSSPRIDSKEPIPPGCVAWWAGTTTLFLLGS